MCIILQTHIENVTTEEIPILCKVENILKGSLDSIPSPSPSVKIQIMGGGKFASGVMAKHCWATNF